MFRGPWGSNTEGAQGYLTAGSKVILTCIIACSKELDGGPTEILVGRGWSIGTGYSVRAWVGGSLMIGEACGVIWSGDWPRIRELGEGARDWD